MLHRVTTSIRIEIPGGREETRRARDKYDIINARLHFSSTVYTLIEGHRVAWVLDVREPGMQDKLPDKYVAQTGDPPDRSKAVRDYMKHIIG